MLWSSSSLLGVAIGFLLVIPLGCTSISVIVQLATSLRQRAVAGKGINILKFPSILKEGVEEGSNSNLRSAVNNN